MNKRQLDLILLPNKNNMIITELTKGALEYAEIRMKWLKNDQEAVKLFNEMKMAHKNLFPDGSMNLFYLEVIESNRRQLSYLFLKHMGYHS